MKIISQITMFDDTQNENLGDLEWLQMVLDALPDEELITKLGEKRGKKRNSYMPLLPVHIQIFWTVLWNARMN